MTELSSVHASPDLPGSDRDGQTARLLASRNSEGLRRLLIDHGGRVRSTLCSEFDKVLDELEIDDALSQATQRVWLHGDRYDPARGTLRAWFYIIARNCARRISYTKGHSTLRFVEDLDAVAGAATASTGEVPADAERERLMRELYRCIDELPGQQRDVILADLAAGGIARTEHLVTQLKTTPNSIYVSRAKARKTLRKVLLALGHPYVVEEGPGKEEVTS